MSQKHLRRPEDVFTPRADEVNVAMYVTRPDLERALKQGLRGNKHLLLYGESGTGKSWLYKRVLTEMRAEYLTANMANASRLGGISAEFQAMLDREGGSVKTGYSETMTGKIGVSSTSAGLGHTGSFTTPHVEPFEGMLKLLRARAGKRRAAVLVIDNLEFVRGTDLSKELADILALCDDSRYASHRVSLLIVGVPHGVRDYFRSTPNLTSIRGRISELPEVSRLPKEKCIELVETGFIEQLGYEAQAPRWFGEQIAWLTDRIPLGVQELSLELAFAAEHSRTLERGDLPGAVQAWLSSSLTGDYTTIEHHMNDRETKVGRKNQVLYVLGQIPKEEFRTADVEAAIRKEFPAVTRSNTALNVSSILGNFSSGEHAFIRRSPKGNAYSFLTPRLRACVRAMLVKTTDGKVEKRPLSDAGQ